MSERERERERERDLGRLGKNFPKLVCVIIKLDSEGEMRSTLCSLNIFHIIINGNI